MKKAMNPGCPGITTLETTKAFREPMNTVKVNTVWIRSPEPDLPYRSRVRIHYPHPDDFQKLVGISLSKGTSVIKFS